VANGAGVGSGAVDSNFKFSAGELGEAELKFSLGAIGLIVVNQKLNDFGLHEVRGGDSAD
jgi:hypothetical protein